MNFRQLPEVIRCHRVSFDHIAEILSISAVDDWYRVNKSDILAQPDGTIIHHYYHTSLFKALSTIYPLTQWQPWKFAKMPHNYWEDVSHHKEYLEWLADQLGIVNSEQWYNVTKEVVVDRGGAAMVVNHYMGSAMRAIMSNYAHIEWQPWRFCAAPTCFWDNHEHHREYFDWLAEQINIQLIEDWYFITKHDVVTRSGGGLLSTHYEDNFSRALQCVYPHTLWQPWRFVTSHLQPTFAKDVEVRKYYMDWIVEQVGVSKLEDWYAVTLEDIDNRARRSLFASVLKHYFGATRVTRTHEAVAALFPSAEWQPWRFLDAPKAMMGKIHNQRKYLDWVAEQLHISQVDDWYRVTAADIYTLGGLKFLKQYFANSLELALTSVYPHTEWQQWRFATVDAPVNARDVGTKNHRKFFDWLAETLGISGVEDWYGVKVEDFLDQKGSMDVMEQYYNKSLRLALKSVYPYTDWQPWRFVGKKVTAKYWRAFKNQEKYLEWIEERLGIEHPKEWEQISSTMVVRLHGSTLLGYIGGLSKLLKNHYPNIEWSSRKTLFAGSISQGVWVRMVKSLLPKNIDVDCNYSPIFLDNPLSSRFSTLEFDLWIPKYNLGIEYQGIQHYIPNNVMGKLESSRIGLGRFTAQVTSDRIKSELCRHLGIFLVCIPCWWHFDKSKLAATIHQV